MKMKLPLNQITTKKGKNGFYKFFLGKRDVTLLWMDFFSGLSMEQEKDCVRLFLKKYGTK